MINKFLNTCCLFFALLLIAAAAPLSARAEGKQERKLLRAPVPSFVSQFELGKGSPTFNDADKRAGFFGETADVVDVTKDDAAPVATKDSFGKTNSKPASIASEQAAPSESAERLISQEVADDAKDHYKPVFDSDSPTKKIQAPDENPQVSINPEASGPALGLVTSYQSGDMDTAQKYAKQWVKYQQNFSFTVRDLTSLIGKALIDQGEIDSDDWVGVPQLIDYEMAKARAETGGLTFRPRHEIAMQRIVPDQKNEAAVYFFFTLNCSWCRKMAPDVERLWRATQNDKRVKMVALTMGPTPKDWVDEYRKYTGLTVPVFQGDNAAKAFGVRFVPAIVIVTPTANKAYLKTGQQTFPRLYDFLRKAQGLPATLTPEVQSIMSTPIGQAEMLQVKSLQSDSKEVGSGAAAPRSVAEHTGSNVLEQF